MALPQGLLARGIAGGAVVPFVGAGTEFMRFANAAQDIITFNNAEGDMDFLYKGSGSGAVAAQYDAGLASWGFGVSPTSGRIATFGFGTAGSNAYTVIAHSDNTNGASHARLGIVVGGTSGGDPLVTYGGSGVSDWAVGVDNSDSDAFEICQAAAMGSSVRLKIDGSGTVTTLGRTSNGAAVRIKQATAEFTALSASSTATNIIPDGAFVLGVTTRIKSDVSFGGGGVSFQVGDGSDVDLWGTSAVLVSGTALGSDDFTTTTAVRLFTAANNIVLTPDAGTFATGSVDLVVNYLDIIDLASALS